MQFQKHLVDEVLKALRNADVECTALFDFVFEVSHANGVDAEVAFFCPSTMPIQGACGIVDGQGKNNVNHNASSMCFYEHDTKQLRALVAKESHAFNIIITESFECLIDEVLLKLHVLGRS